MTRSFVCFVSGQAVVLALAAGLVLACVVPSFTGGPAWASSPARVATTNGARGIASAPKIGRQPKAKAKAKARRVDTTANALAKASGGPSRATWWRWLGRVAPRTADGWLRAGLGAAAGAVVAPAVALPLITHGAMPADAVGTVAWVGAGVFTAAGFVSRGLVAVITAASEPDQR